MFLILVELLKHIFKDIVFSAVHVILTPRVNGRLKHYSYLRLALPSDSHVAAERLRQVVAGIVLLLLLLLRTFHPSFTHGLK